MYQRGTARTTPPHVMNTVLLMIACQANPNICMYCYLFLTIVCFLPKWMCLRCKLLGAIIVDSNTYISFLMIRNIECDGRVIKAFRYLHNTDYYLHIQLNNAPLESLSHSQVHICIITSLCGIQCDHCHLVHIRQVGFGCHYHSQNIITYLIDLADCYRH